MNYKDFLEGGSSTDKTTYHGYHRIYPWFLGHLKAKQNVKLLEIGAHEMGSVKLWRNYFNAVDLTIIDKDEKKMEGVRCVQLDQSDRGALEVFSAKNLCFFDIVVDDGSHVPSHQILTLKSLWKSLKPRGIYIIEDIETSYWGRSEIYGYNFNSNDINIINEFKKGLDLINSEFNNTQSTKNKSLVQEIIIDAEMITFAYNCVIVVKKSPEFSSFYDREYRFDHKVNELNGLRLFKRRFLKKFWK